MKENIENKVSATTSLYYGTVHDVHIDLLYASG